MRGWPYSGNGGLDNNALIEGTVKFVLNGVSGFTEADIKNVYFTYGTSAGENTVPGTHEFHADDHRHADHWRCSGACAALAAGNGVGWRGLPHAQARAQGLTLRRPALVRVLKMDEPNGSSISFFGPVFPAQMKNPQDDQRGEQMSSGGLITRPWRSF